MAVRHLLSLAGSDEDLRGRMKAAARSDVRRARREGVTVRLSGSPADLPIFYRLHLLTRRRLGVPIQLRPPEVEHLVALVDELLFVSQQQAGGDRLTVGASATASKPRPAPTTWRQMAERKRRGRAAGPTLRWRRRSGGLGSRQWRESSDAAYWGALEVPLQCTRSGVGGGLRRGGPAGGGCGESSATRHPSSASSLASCSTGTRHDALTPRPARGRAARPVPRSTARPTFTPTS